MEKVRITKRESELIESFKEDFNMNFSGMSFNKFVSALKDGYEVEPEFKKGDFVVWHGDVVEIKHPQTNDHKDDGCCYFTLERSDGSTYGNITRDEIRLATPSEIAEEKERRFFAEHGREPWELKKNDILNDRRENYTVTIAKVIDKFPAEEITVLFTNGDWESYNNIVEDSDWRVACFADKRLDVKTNE